MFCEKCGAKLLADAAFCENCGAPVKTAATPPIQAQAHTTYSQPSPQRRKSGAKIGIIILIVVLLVAAAAAVLWFAGIIGGGTPDGDTPDTPFKQAKQTTAEPDAPFAQAEQTAGESDIPPAQEEQTAVEPDTPFAQAEQIIMEPKPQETPTPSAELEIEAFSEANGESMQLSTTDTPTAEDFAWFTDKAERWVYGITPADAYMMEDFNAIVGSWKGLSMIYDYDGTVLGYCYFTAAFDESDTDVAATIDWRYIDWADGGYDELTDREDESLTGSFAAPTLELGEAGNRVELILYALDGKQYAEGKWTVQSGEEVRVALVRP